jgi:hypothetical protein
MELGLFLPVSLNVISLIHALYASRLLSFGRERIATFLSMTVLYKEIRDNDIQNIYGIHPGMQIVYDHLMVQFFPWKPNMTDPIKKSSQPEKPRAASSSLQGFPGYRTRAGRSGLDPVDNDAESGHMAGVFIRRLLTGRLRTRNPITLLLLALLGLACIAPLLLAVLEALRGDLLPFGAWVLITISFLFGVLLLFNLVRALLY